MTPALIPVEDIERGQGFRKLQGTFVYLRISDLAVKHLGLEYKTYVYGVCFNGNVTKIQRDKLVVPEKPGKMDANRASIELLDNIFSSKEDNMNETTTLTRERRLHDLKTGERAITLNGREVMKLADGRVAILDTGTYAVNLECFLQSNIIHVSQMKPGDFGVLEESGATVFKLEDHRTAYLADGTYVSDDPLVHLKDSVTVKRS